MLSYLLKRFWFWPAIAVISFVLGMKFCPKPTEKIESIDNTREHVVTTIKERRDGSKETRIVERRTKKSQRSEVRVIKPQWSVGVQADSEAITGGNGTYTFRVERRVLGDLYIGGYGSTDKEYGVSLSYQF